MGLFRLAFLGGLTGLVIMSLKMLDVGKEVYTHHPGHCEHLPTIKDGAEDVILTSDGYAIISSGIHIFGQPGPHATGRFYAYDLRPDAPQPRKLVELGISGHPDRDGFHPAGIAVWKDLLYAVDAGKRKIDVFSYSIPKGSAKYLRSITDPNFGAVNNLVLVGEDTFYVTNFLKSTHWLMMNLEMAVPLGTGSVLFHEKGKGAQRVVSGLKGPNGLDLSKDGRHLYVATTQDELFHVYQRNTRDNSLRKVEEAYLGSGADNVNTDPQTGDVYIGSHPITYKLLMNMNNREYATPSQVLRVKLDHTKKPVVRGVSEVFADSGTFLKGATAAVKLGDKMLIGTLSDKAVICNVGYMP